MATPRRRTSTWSSGSGLATSTPVRHCAALTTSEIGNLNEPYWSNAQYDKLALEQASTVDPQKRAQVIWQMQQLMYQQSPWIPMTFPD